MNDLAITSSSFCYTRNSTCLWPSKESLRSDVPSKGRIHISIHIDSFLYNPEIVSFIKHGSIMKSFYIAYVNEGPVSVRAISGAIRIASNNGRFCLRLSQYRRQKRLVFS